jgi:AcrR family transcriptional regulator
MPPSLIPVPTPVPVPYAVAARDLLRNTLLDAMRAELQRRPWADISMVDVAKAAGVSRQTLYKEFGSRAEFAQAYVVREADRFVEAVEGAVAAHPDDPVVALNGAFELFLRAAAEDPLVRTIVSGEAPDELLPLVTTRGEAVLERATAQLSAVMRRHWPNVDGDDAEVLADAVVRLAISHAASPGGPSDQSAQAVSRLLEPFIRRAVG